MSKTSDILNERYSTPASAIFSLNGNKVQVTDITKVHVEVVSVWILSCFNSELRRVIKKLHDSNFRVLDIKMETTTSGHSSGVLAFVTYYGEIKKEGNETENKEA